MVFANQNHLCDTLVINIQNNCDKIDKIKTFSMIKNYNLQSVRINKIEQTQRKTDSG